MGIYSSRAIRKADQQFDKTCTFVRYAMLGDLVNLKQMLAKEKMDPNAQDQNRTPLEELDANPSPGTDIVPGQISTARVNEELEEWRHTVQSDAQMKSKARTGSFPSAIVGKYSKRGSKSGSDDGVENTLITKFGASIREVSERQSSDCSASSRTSSAQSGMWAHIAAPSDGSGSSTPSSVATSAHGAPPSVVVPLDLASVNAQSNAAATQSSSSVSPIVSDTITRIPEDSVQHRPVVDKNLKYTGARVMTMLRVKQTTPLDEKKETIRLLLLKHMQPSGGGSLETQSSIGANAAEGNSTLPLQQAVSGLTLSLPP